MMEVRDIMHRDVISVRPDMTVKEVARVLVENNINGAPVVDEEGHLVGIITMADLISLVKRRMEALGFVVAMTPFDIFDFYAMEIAAENRDALREISNVRVSEIMKKKVHFVREDDDILDVVNILSRKDISRVPVVDRDGRVIGIVARSDIIRLIAEGKLSDEVSE